MEKYSAVVRDSVFGSCLISFIIVAATTGVGLTEYLATPKPEYAGALILLGWLDGSLIAALLVLWPRWLGGRN